MAGCCGIRTTSPRGTAYGRGCYRDRAVFECHLPPDLAVAFTPSPEGLRLADEYRRDVKPRVQDVRVVAPEDRFHLILCRYLVLTYFDEALRRRLRALLIDKLEPGGALVVGATERVPEGLGGLVPWSSRLRIYRAATPAGAVAKTT